MRARYFGPLCVVAVVCMVAGCMDSTTIVMVRKNGGGTVTETVLVNEIVAARVALDGAGANASNMVERCRARAGRMGRGVSLVRDSAKEMSRNGMVGHQAVYSFDDVRALRLDQHPDLSGLGRYAPQEQGKVHPITFDFEKSGQPALSIMIPPPFEKPQTAEVAGGRGVRSAVSIEQMAVIRKLFENFRVRILVKVDGEIVRTNAKFVEKEKDTDNTVTLVDMDVSKLIENDSRMNKILAMGRIEDMDTARMKLRDLPGLRIETTGRVDVVFQ